MTIFLCILIIILGTGAGTVAGYYLPIRYNLIFMAVISALVISMLIFTFLV